MKKKKINYLKYLIVYCIIIVSVLGIVYFFNKNKDTKTLDEVEWTTIKSEKEYKAMFKSYNKNKEVLKNIFTLPVSALTNGLYRHSYNDVGYMGSSVDAMNTNGGFAEFSASSPASSESTKKSSSSNSTSDYSKTNVQVENVDEADVVKTDGEYIYSISDEYIVISKTDSTGKVEIITQLAPSNTPQDFFIKDNKLVVITYVEDTNQTYYSSSNTTVEIYDISNKEKISSLKKIELDKSYYTSRIIGDKVYIITTGVINSNYSNDYEPKLPSFTVDGNTKDLSYDKINYIKDKNYSSNYISVIATIDLLALNNEPSVNGYMIPTENAYVSENNLYIAFEKKEYLNNSDDNTISNIKKLFGFGGIIGFIKLQENIYDDYYNTEYKKYTNILKFEFTDTGIKYVSSAKEEGSTLNQFSMDEYNGNLRVTLSKNTEKSKLVVYSDKMKKIGEVDNIAPGEKIYSTRFINDRAYVVTYKTVDPLFVIDLKDPTAPKILGELKIPGYSTYLHPYDENHIIGIGNATDEIVSRDSMGKVISKRAVITGMKMAIFDVTDVANPKEQFSQKIGDKYTYSSILKNHKALLFSKEKELIAIPVNNYKEAIEVNLSNNDQVDSATNITSKINKAPIESGYIVYNINLKDGFKEKGIITHKNSNSNYNSYWYGSNDIVRGLYIGNNLYTISKDYIKSHTLEKLEQISSIKIGG